MNVADTWAPMSLRRGKAGSTGPSQGMAAGRLQCEGTFDHLGISASVLDQQKQHVMDAGAPVAGGSLDVHVGPLLQPALINNIVSTSYQLPEKNEPDDPHTHPRDSPALGGNTLQTPPTQPPASALVPTCPRLRCLRDSARR